MFHPFVQILFSTIISISSFVFKKKSPNCLGFHFGISSMTKTQPTVEISGTNGPTRGVSPSAPGLAIVSLQAWRGGSRELLLGVFRRPKMTQSCVYMVGVFHEFAGDTPPKINSWNLKGSKLPLFPYNRGWETQPNNSGFPRRKSLIFRALRLR